MRLSESEIKNTLKDIEQGIIKSSLGLEVVKLLEKKHKAKLKDVGSFQGNATFYFEDKEGNVLFVKAEWLDEETAKELREEW